MISFKEFINEAAILLDGVRFENKTFAEMVKGFKGLKYKFCGTYTFSTKKYNAFRPKGFDSVFEYYANLEKKVYGENYEKLSEYYYIKTSGISSLDIFHAPDKYGKMTDKEYDETIYNPDSKEKVVRFNDGYCFWSQSKYFYFISLGKYDTFGTKALDYLKLWLKIKTSSEDGLIDQMKTRLDSYFEHLRIQKQKEEQEKEKDKKKQEVLAIESKIKADYKSNPSKYKDVGEIDNLPKDVLDDLQEREPWKQIDGNYFSCCIKSIDSTPYDEVLYLYAVNNRDLTDGYVYQIWFDKAKPGTYWGD